MLRIIKIVTSKTYVQKALILNGFFLLAQPPGERERTIVTVILTILQYSSLEVLIAYSGGTKDCSASLCGSID